MKNIQEIEKIVDKKCSELSIWSYPAHITLTTLYNLIYELFFSDNVDRLTDRFKAERIMSYLSGVSSHLSKCDGSVIKIDEKSSIQFSEDMKADIQSIIEYGQFCTIMDRMHKGEFFEKNSDGHILLHLKDEEAFALEAQDILISELSLPHFLQPKHVFDHDYAFRLGSGKAHFEPEKVAKQVHLQRIAFARFDNDIEYIGDFSDVIRGVSDEDFRSLKLSAIAFALYIRSVSRLLEEAIRTGVISGPKANSKLIFWKAPCLKRSDVLTVLAKAASVTIETATAFVDSFSMAIGGDCPPWVKSGYFPPFQYLGERTIFSPAVLLAMMNNRNAIYLCSKNNEEVFHNVVSERMEPKLIEDFLLQIPPDSGWVCETSIKFPGSEIDLVCFHPQLNLALQIQAKGSIAPEGAVLVRNFEGRCEEGVIQLRKFDALPKEEKMQLLQRKVPTINSDTIVVPCLLARGSFGRPDFLQRNRDIMFLNPFLASKIFADGEFDWTDPVGAMRNFGLQLSKHVDCVSNREKFQVFQYEIYVEMPLWDRKKLNSMIVSTTLSQMIRRAR